MVTGPTESSGAVTRRSILYPETPGLLLFVILIVACLLVARLQNVILFHSLVEVIVVVMAFGVFLVAATTYRHLDNKYLFFIGIAYGFVAMLDLVHVLSEIIIGYSWTENTNLTLQTRLAARFLEAFSFLAGFLILGRRQRLSWILALDALIFGALIWAIFLGRVFPALYVEGQGVTPFEIISEYAIFLTLFASIFLLVRYRRHFDTRVFRFLIASLILIVFSEVCLSFYLERSALNDILGQVSRIFGTFLIFAILVEMGLKRPYARVVRDLERSEEKLREQRDEVQRYLDVARVMLVALDRAGRVVLINRKGSEILQHADTDILGKNWFETFCPTAHRKPLQKRFEMLGQGESEERVDLEYPVLSGSGEQRLIAWHETVLTSERGEVIGTLSSGEDITDRKKIEAAIEGAKRDWERTFDTVPDLIAILDASGRVTRINRAMAHQVGVDPVEGIGLDCFELLPCKEEGPSSCCFREAGAQHPERSREVYDPVSKSHYLISMSMLADAEGRQEGAIYVARDITEQKRVEEELKGYRARLEQLVEARTTELRKANESLKCEVSERRHAQEEVRRMALFAQFNPDPVLRFDRRGHVLMANKAAVDILQMSAPHGVHLSDALPGIAQIDLAGCIRNGRRHSHVSEIAGRCYQFAILGIPEFNWGQIYGSDVTELRRAGEAIRLNEARLEALLRLSQMQDASREAMADYVLREAVQLTKSQIGFLGFVDEDESVTGLQRWFMPKREGERISGAEDWPLEESGLWGEIRRHRIPIVVNEVQTPHASPVEGGEVRAPIQRYLGVPLFHGNRIAVVLGVGNKDDTYDESDIRQVTLLLEGMWQQLEGRRARAEALRCSRLASLGELAAGVAHEINNPINGIINCAEILARKTTEGGGEAEFLRRILAEGERIEVIVRSLLSFARDSHHEMRSAGVQEVLAGVLTLLGAQLKKDGIVMKINLPDELPEVLVDVAQIQQVFLNVINNARYALNSKYPVAEEAKVLQISGTLTRKETEAFVDIAFHDAGIGIPGSVLDRVIDPFFSTKPTDEGTGLGLSISHGIIENHGGRLRIESREGEYTCVSISLPAPPGTTPAPSKSAVQERVLP